MANELAQWITLFILIFVLLGTIRQLSLLMPVHTRSGDGGPEVGKKLPRELVAVVRQAFPQADDGFAVAFVTESCPACRRLLSNLETPGRLGKPLLLVAKSPSAAFGEALAALRYPLIQDRDARLWTRCAVTATPLVVLADDAGHVLSKEITHHVENL